MNCCYIISTCDKYLETRVQYQMNTFLKDVNKEDIFYLTSQPNHQERHFGWYCMDTFETITWKYIHFIHNMENILNYDWYIFIDDDTFVFKNRIEKLLENYNKNDLYYIGNELDHVEKEFCKYMSGGAGYLISNGLYREIFNYVKKNGINNSYKHWCDDLCIGLWINELKKNHNIIQIHNPNFFIEQHKDENKLKNALTFHKVYSPELFNFYNEISITERINELNKNFSKTTNQIIPKLDIVVVLITDSMYFPKAKRTIIDIRSKGNWHGDIILITIGFDLNNNFKDFYRVTEVKFDLIDKTNLLQKIGENGFSNSDKRELTKLNQWEKLHVFDDYFMKWNRVIYFDAGLRVLDDIQYLLDLDYKGKILAPKDGKNYENASFKCQLSYDDPDKIERIKTDFGEDILEQTYFLNCIWIYDTNILRLCDKQQMINAMNNYTLCKTNEMGIMNLLLRFKYNFWEPFPFKLSNGKILFDWCELNNPNTNWRDYCYIKYPVTISFDDC